MTVPSKIFDFIIDPIRSADRRQGHDFLRRYLEGFQSVWETTDAKIFDVTKLWSITDCPNEQLAFLKQIVGWTNDLDNITRELSYDELRRLIAISMRIWKRRGTESSIEDILFFATGARARVWNWFFFRWIIGETLFGEEHEGYDPWIVPDAGEDEQAEYLSQLRIVDDGTLNRTLVMNLLRLMRACSERWEVIYLTFLDTFLVAGDSTQWTTDNAPHLIVINNSLVISAVGAEEYTENMNGLTLKEGIFNVRCKTDGDKIDLRWKDENDDLLYYIWIGTDSDASPSYLTLVRYVDGVPDTLFEEEIPEFPVHKNVYYMFRATFSHEVDGRVRIQFFIDGNEMFNETDDQFVPIGPELPAFPTLKKIVFATFDATLTISEVEIVALPVETDVISINEE